MSHYESLTVEFVGLLGVQRGSRSEAVRLRHVRLLLRIDVEIREGSPNRFGVMRLRLVVVMLRLGHHARGGYRVEHAHRVIRRHGPAHWVHRGGSDVRATPGAAIRTRPTMP